MHTLSRLAIFAAALASLAGSLEGQDRSAVLPGDTIRVTGRGVHGILTVLAATDSALDLRDRKGEVRTVPFSDLRRVERLEGRSRAGGMVHGAFLGLLGGAVVGAGVGHLMDDPDAFFPGSVVGAFFGGIGGLVVGTSIGARRGTPRWRKVNLASP